MIEKLYQHFLKSGLISTDTRNILPGSIFFALKGGNFNGNHFAEEALQKGAVLAVIDEEPFRKDDQYFLVPDVLKALQDLANHHRRQLDIPVLALTGSNGKTTTKELINAVIGQKFKTLATKGNLNNHIGVPLTLLSIQPEHEFAIIEMGANHQGEIRDLCKIAEPEFGMITNIGKAHIEGFGGVEGIKKGKGELFDFLRSGDTVIFVNYDDPVLMEMSEGLERRTYGSYEDADTVARVLSSDPFLEIDLLSSLSWEIIKTKLVGSYNFPNVLAAISIGRYFGVTDEQIKTGIENYLPDNNRSQVLRKEKNTLIMDAYNANPSSMKVAIENFSGMKADHKFFILGDMLELGEATQIEHQNIIELAEQLGLTGLFVGPRFEKVRSGSSLFFSSADEAIDQLKKMDIQNSLVLIKGSRGMKLERLAEFL